MSTSTISRCRSPVETGLSIVPVDVLRPARLGQGGNGDRVRDLVGLVPVGTALERHLRVVAADGHVREAVVVAPVVPELTPADGRNEVGRLRIKRRVRDAQVPPVVGREQPRRQTAGGPGRRADLRPVVRRGLLGDRPYITETKKAGDQRDNHYEPTHMQPPRSGGTLTDWFPNEQESLHASRASKPQEICEKVRNGRNARGEGRTSKSRKRHHNDDR